MKLSQIHANFINALGALLGGSAALLGVLHVVDPRLVRVPLVNLYYHLVLFGSHLLESLGLFWSILTVSVVLFGPYVLFFSFMLLPSDSDSFLLLS